MAARGQGQAARAVRLLAAEEGIRAARHQPLPGDLVPEHRRHVASVQAQLDETAFTAAWAEGRAMTVGDAIEYALTEQIAASQSSVPAPTHDPNALTPRELEVLRLVASGMTDVQVAEKLVISPRTVNTHLSSIYSKLGVNSRTAATRYALEQKLI